MYYVNVKKRRVLMFGSLVELKVLYINKIKKIKIKVFPFTILVLNYSHTVALLE